MELIKIGWFWGIIPIIVIMLSMIIIVTVVDLIVKSKAKIVLRSALLLVGTMALLLIISSIPNIEMPSFIGYLVNSITTIPVTA